MFLQIIDSPDNLERFVADLIDKGTNLGWTLLKACLVFFIGRYLIKLLIRLMNGVLNRRKIDPSVQSFISSLVNIVLLILLVVSVVGILGIQTTSFAALLASAGVTIGIALSGNLSNFAGGIIILVFKPFKVGDFIEAQNISGTVRAIQIFHTIVTTSDNKRIFVPNGSLSSGVVVNVNVMHTRRVEWIFGIEYGSDYEQIRSLLLKLVEEDKRILTKPAPMVVMKGLESSNINIMVRGWVKTADYWSVFFDMNKRVYETFNAHHISFPYPQLTVHSKEMNG